MGIEPPYIGLYGVWSMVGIEVRGMGWFGLRLGWSCEVQGISNPDCNTSVHANLPRLNPEEPCLMSVPIHTQESVGCHLRRYRMPHYPLSRD